jgi:hypothetical protein
MRSINQEGFSLTEPGTSQTGNQPNQDPPNQNGAAEAYPCRHFMRGFFLLIT